MSGLTRSVRLILALALLGGLAHVAAAQGTGTITGTIRNSTDNSVVAGAQVGIPGTSIAQVTNDGGRFVLANVPAGTHTIDVRHLGYAPERRENVVVIAGQTINVDFSMRTRVLTLSDVVVTGVTEATSKAKLPFTVASINADAMPVP